LNANLTVGFLLNLTFISFKIMSRPEVRATKIIFSWKGDEPEWSPNEPGTD